MTEENLSLNQLMARWLMDEFSLSRDVVRYAYDDVSWLDDNLSLAWIKWHGRPILGVLSNGHVFVPDVDELFVTHVGPIFSIHDKELFNKLRPLAQERIVWLREKMWGVRPYYVPLT